MTPRTWPDPPTAIVLVRQPGKLWERDRLFFTKNKTINIKFYEGKLPDLINKETMWSPVWCKMSDNQSSLQTVSSQHFSENKLKDFKQQDFLSKFEGSWLQKRKGIGIKLKSAKNGDFYIRKYVTGTTLYKYLTCWSLTNNVGWWVECRRPQIHLLTQLELELCHDFVNKKVKSNQPAGQFV